MSEGEYRGIRFTDTGPLLQLRHIEALETLYDIHLPDAYRAFLLEVNGGCPRPSGYKLLSEPEPAMAIGSVDPAINADYPAFLMEFLKNSYVPQRIERFLGIRTEGATSLDQQLSFQKVTSRPDQGSLMTIAFDTSNRRFYMSLCPEFYEHIYVVTELDGLLDEAWAPLSELNDHLVARSFDELLRRIFPARVLLREGYTPTEELCAIFRVDDYDE
jgi:hypothetical protein